MFFKHRIIQIEQKTLTITPPLFKTPTGLSASLPSKNCVNKPRRIW